LTAKLAKDAKELGLRNWQDRALKARIPNQKGTGQALLANFASLAVKTWVPALRGRGF
jgi:hypothetical protein